MLVMKANLRCERRTTARLLRRRGSQRYFNGSDWTDDPCKARSFVDIIEAAEACIRHDLTDVEVALRLDQCDVFCTPLR